MAWPASPFARWALGNGVQAEWEPDELIDAWTLTGGDWDLIANKAGVTRLGFAVMLKFYEIEGRSQIRKVYGTRPPTEDDEDRWAARVRDVRPAGGAAVAAECAGRAEVRPGAAGAGHAAGGAVLDPAGRACRRAWWSC
jgi:hypothetical protein